MHTIALPWFISIGLKGIAIIDAIGNALRFSKDDSVDADDSDDDVSDAWEDDDTFSGFDDEDDTEDDDSDDDDSDDDSDDENDSDEDSEDKDLKTAIHQKKRYRERLKKAEEKIAELEGKKDDEGNLSTADEKEKAAEEYLAKKIKDVIKAIENEDKQMTAAQQEKFDAEVESVLDENPRLNEKDIVALCEELGVTPTQAGKILLREGTSRKKAKPAVPKDKGGAPRIRKSSQTDEKKPATLDEVARRIKAGL